LAPPRVRSRRSGPLSNCLSCEQIYRVNRTRQAGGVRVLASSCRPV
jgi:hypothetical protein